MSRFLHDDKFGWNLCLPDILALNIFNVDNSATNVIYTIGAAYVHDDADLRNIQQAKPAILSNTFISFKRPSGNPNILSFRYIQTDILSATLSTTVTPGYSDTFLRELGNDASLFSPEYKGVIEDIFKLVEVDSAELNIKQIKEFNSLKADVVETIDYFDKLFQTSLPNSKARKELIKKIINEHAQIFKDREAESERWKVSFEDKKGIKVVLKQLLPKDESVFADSNNLTVKLQT